MWNLNSLFFFKLVIALVTLEWCCKKIQALSFKFKLFFYCTYRRFDSWFNKSYKILDGNLLMLFLKSQNSRNICHYFIHYLSNQQLWVSNKISLSGSRYYCDFSNGFTVSYPVDRMLGLKADFYTTLWLITA